MCRWASRARRKKAACCSCREPPFPTGAPVAAYGSGPHLVFLFHDALPTLLAVLDGLRDTLRAVFVEHRGRFAKL